MAKYPLEELISENEEGRRVQHTEDKDVKQELESIKQTQQAILDRLDGTIDTQLIGSKVEYVRKSTDPRPEGKANDSLFFWDTRQLLLHDGTDWREV